MQLPVFKNGASRPAAHHAPDAPDAPLVSRTFKVGELAKLAGKTVRALHLYEERGLLEPQERSRGGYRLYGDAALRRVAWIAKMQDMGYSLSDLQAIATEWKRAASAPRVMARVEATLRDKLRDTREQVQRLQALENELVASLEYLEACPSCDPRQEVEACHQCDLHDEGELAPDLVAGFRPPESSSTATTSSKPAPAVAATPESS